ncbi:MAG: enoyl-CoA hydratase-related protein [Actinomycetes bacterium]
MADLVSVSVVDSVATIRLDRPPMNVLSTQMQDELRAAAIDVGQRSDVAAVVVYGGPSVFAAGADVKEMATMAYADMAARSAALQASFTAVAHIPKPVVAAITGYALGAGCELALAADFRVCADNARLGQPEILLGIIPGAGGTQRLSRLIGPAKAKDLVFSGRFVAADEALALGLVDEVVPSDDVYDAALRRAATFVGGPRLALRAAKEAIDSGLDVDLDTGLAIERMQFTALFATDDRGIGMTSFTEHGPGHAQFTGQ